MLSVSLSVSLPATYSSVDAMHSMQATLAIAAHDHIGEAPLWDIAAMRLIWVDHVRGHIHEAQAGVDGSWQETRCRHLDRATGCAIPRAGAGLVIVAGNEIFFLDEDSNTRPFVCLDIDPKQIWLNDAKCDAQGRLWTGTLAGDFSARGALYRIDADGSVHTLLENIRLANGLDWSPDNSTFYFIDSLACTVDAFDFDLQQGEIANQRTLITFAPAEGLPNGMCVDREGCLWVALTGSGEVRRFTPDGKLLSSVSIAVPGVTSCAFGGVDGESLFITSRSGRVPEIIKTLGLPEYRMESTGPRAGGLFVCQPGASGMPAHVFAG